RHEYGDRNPVFPPQPPRAPRRPVEYHIDGLGTDKVRARAVSPDGERDISADVLRRSKGEDRAFRFEETFFDGYTGKRWNWVGSDRSGGRKKPIKPGGIGNVNISAVNDFDQAAKKHDINLWLGQNFPAGASVYITIDGQKKLFTVEPAATAHIGATA